MATYNVYNGSYYKEQTAITAVCSFIATKLISNLYHVP